MKRPDEFRVRARECLKRGVLYQVLAAASALRVHVNSATADDVSLILEYAAFPNPAVKAFALHAISYMGQKTVLQQALLNAVLAVDVDGNPRVASALVEGFGPYSVHIDQLTHDDVSNILRELAPIDDLDTNQGRIPMFLSSIVQRFSDEVLNFSYGTNRG